MKLPFKFMVTLVKFSLEFFGGKVSFLHTDNMRMCLFFVALCLKNIKGALQSIPSSHLCPSLQSIILNLLSLEFLVL